MSTKITLEFDNDDMAHAFVANLLDGGGEETCCKDYDEENGVEIYFVWDHENSKKVKKPFYTHLRYRLIEDEE